MGFAPVLLGTGYAGWRALKATLPQQQQAFARSAETRRELSAFAAAIPKIADPGDFVGSYAAMRVGLQAFGLQDDMSNRFFLRRVLSEGVDAPDALANRLQDTRYRRFAEAFSPAKLALGIPGLSGNVATVTEKYLRAGLEQAIGAQDPDMRLALAFEHDLPELTQETASPRAAWYGVLASPSLSSVFRTVFGLPEAFARLDIDRQHEVFQTKAKALFGTADLAALSTPDQVESIIQRFMVRKQMQTSQSTSASAVALTLVQQIPRRSLLPSGGAT